MMMMITMMIVFRFELALKASLLDLLEPSKIEHGIAFRFRDVEYQDRITFIVFDPL